MFSLHSGLRFHFYLPVCDMRKGFNGLCGIVRNELGREPDSGEAFIFLSRQRDSIKVLHWESGGFVLYYKQLQQGRFSLPKTEGTSLLLSYAQWVLLVQGLELETKGVKKRYKN